MEFDSIDPVGTAFRYPNHPPIELCPSCNSMGKIQDSCCFQPKEPRK